MKATGKRKRVDRCTEAEGSPAQASRPSATHQPHTQLAAGRPPPQTCALQTSRLLVESRVEGEVQI